MEIVLEIVVGSEREIVLEITVSSVAHACVGYRRNSDPQYNLNFLTLTKCNNFLLIFNIITYRSSTEVATSLRDQKAAKLQRRPELTHSTEIQVLYEILRQTD
jgi:hypothetical protein